MAKHVFKITVERVDDQHGDPGNDPPLVFTAQNHDNILELAARRGGGDERQLAFIVGLKLLGEALLADRDNPLYRDFIPHFGEFMKNLKQSRQHGRDE